MSKTDSSVGNDTAGLLNNNFFGILRTTNTVTDNITFVNSNAAVAINVGINGAYNYSQGAFAVAIGSNAGFINQGESAIALGTDAGSSNQGAKAVALGVAAGSTGQGLGAVAIGVEAGQYNQGVDTVAIGYDAGRYNQDVSAVAIGFESGLYNQGVGAVSVGNKSGQTSQGDYAVATGYQAGNFLQGDYAVAVGYQAGYYSQGAYAVAVGYQSGYYLQSSNSVTVGYQAGLSGQKENAVAVGYQAGYCNQGTNAVAVGYQAGYTNQGTNAVAVGYQAGYTNQGLNAVAIGHQAGYTNQGKNSVAIGYRAGYKDQSENTIIINATGSELNGTDISRCYIKPIRSDNTATPNAGILNWNPTTKEVVQYTSKTFVIDHPDDKEKYLVHACLEGPEVGVYYRGSGEITDVDTMGRYYADVDLPEYVNSVAYDFTVIAKPVMDDVSSSDDIENELEKCVVATDIENNNFRVFSNKPTIFNWLVHGKRYELQTEIDKNDRNNIVLGEGPYKYVKLINN